ncbi:MAG: diguanylate cyclase [Acidaminococcaceae bacterium]
MNFDIRSLLIAFNVIIWINFIVMTLTWYNAKLIRNAIGYWSFSQALFSFGTLLLVLRNFIPDFLSILVANLCLIGAHVAVQEGLARFMNRGTSLRKASFAILTLHLAAIFYFTYFMPSVTSRIVMYSISTGLIFAINIKTVWQKGKVEDAPLKFLIITLVLGIVISALRMVSALTDGYYFDLMYSGFVQAVSIIGMLLIYVALSISQFWLVIHKLGLEIQRQAMIDPLTNIGNRRALDAMMESQLPIRACNSIGIMMIDVDRFKEINDQFGHQAGDYYLIELVKVINETESNLFRFGGDEFVAIVHNIDNIALMQKAEYLKQKVEKLTINWLDQGQINTTVSIGMSVADHHKMNWDELVKSADDALYRVKKQRRK